MGDAKSVIDAFVARTEEKILGHHSEGFAAMLTPQQKDALRERRLNFPNTRPGQVGLSCGKYWSYCAPSFSTVPLTVLISAFVMAFYEKIGADLSALAFFVALGGGLEVVMDPAMSYMTDSCRTSMGRRRPFLIIGCVPYALSFLLLLTPGGPGIGTLSPTAASAWFGGFYMLFKCANSFTNIPYDALAPEVTDHPPSRSKLFFFCTIFDGLGSLCAAALPIGLQGIVTIYRTPKYDSCEAPNAAGVIDLGSCSDYHSESRLAMNWTMAASAQDRGWATNASFCSDADNEDGTYGARGVLAAGDAEYEDMQSYCNCRSFCLSANSLDNTRGSYFTVGLFFGCWYIMTMATCVYNITERCQAGLDTNSAVEALPKPAPPMPSSLKTFRNRPFTLLLPAWVCDALVTALISSLLTYFIRYIVEPEYAETGDATGCLEGRNTAKWECQSDIVLGFSILSVLFAAVIGSPVWLFLSNPSRLGKRNTWLLWSLVMAITNPLYLFVGSGEVYKVILISFINGLPFGAKFLSDAILADVIDYDEFLTGTRAEATYTMFKSFLPKMAAIPAAAIPTALLNMFGHIAPVDGVYQKQTSAALLLYIKAVVIIIPSCLSFIAFLFKVRFPLRTTEQNTLISAGIGQHSKARQWVAAQKKKHDNWGTPEYAPYGLIADWYNSGSTDKLRADLKNRKGALPEQEDWEARDASWNEVVRLFWSDPRHYLPPRLQPMDPISYVHYNLIDFPDNGSANGTPSELDEMNRMDNFPGVDVTARFKDSPEQAAQQLLKRAYCQLGLVVLLLAISCVGVAMTGEMLFPEEAGVKGQDEESSDSSDTSFVPVLFIVVVGVSITLSIAACLRLCAARSIARRVPSADMIEKIHIQREQVELAEDIDTSFCAGMTRAKLEQDGADHRTEQAKLKAKDADFYLPVFVDDDGGEQDEERQRLDLDRYVVSKLQEAFASYDVDRDGTITLDELQNAADTLEFRGSDGSRHSRDELQTLVNTADTDKDGLINFEEFGKRSHPCSLHWLRASHHFRFVWTLM